MPLFQKLKRRILLLAVTLTSLLLLLSFSAIYLTTIGNATRQTNQKLSELEKIGLPAYRSENLEDDYDLSFMLSVDAKGKLQNYYSRCQYPDYQEDFQAAADFALQNGRFGTYRYYHSDWRYHITKDKQGQLVITFLEITDDLTNQRQLLLTLIIVGAGSLVIIFWLSRYFSGRAILPVIEAWERQKRFVADASHELKTPLMTIMSNCEVLEAFEAETIASQREWLDPIKIGASRMADLINHLLTLARLDGTENQEEKTAVDLQRLIHTIVQSQEAKVQAKQLTVQISSLPQDILTYPDTVGQIMTILYDNAVKYTPENGSIQISCQTRPNYLSLTVKNTGQGISAADLPHLFERFYRTDTAHTDGNSYGLGLAIASAAAERVKGQLTVKSQIGEWTAFTLTI